MADNQSKNRVNAETELKQLASHIGEAMTGWDPQAPVREALPFERLALEVFALQFELNLPYRRFCDARGVTPEICRHWTRIPAVPTEAFKYSDLSCLARDSRSRVFHSSGTTGHRPSRHYHSPESLRLYEASLWPWFEDHLLREWGANSGSVNGFGLAILTPQLSEVPNSSLVHMFETIRLRLGADRSAYVGCLDPEGNWQVDVPAALRQIGGELRVLVVGTAFSLVHLLEGLESAGRRVVLPPGSRVMETGGYKGRSRSFSRMELHARVTRVLGVPSGNIISEYGMSELSSQAYDRAVGMPVETPGQFRFPPWARAVVVSPEHGNEVAEGETGLIRVHDLANAFSVIAVQTEDLGVRRGDGFELLGRALESEVRGCSLRSAAEVLAT